MRSEGRLLLITPATESTSSEAEQFARKTAAELDGKDATGVLRSSRRSYPALILADDDLWIDLEKETQANMALSPEESEVLESARKGERPFPLFINGRAGSGKSTILQYLFAGDLASLTQCCILLLLHCVMATLCGLRGHSMRESFCL